MGTWRPIKDDPRYTIAKEWCGYANARWVARFCGDWLGQGESMSDAQMICLAAADQRERDIAQ